MMTGRLTGWSSCCRQMFHVKSGCSARQKQVTQVKESDVCCSHSSVSVDTSFILSAALPWLGFLQQMPLPSLIPSSLLRSFCVCFTQSSDAHILWVWRNRVSSVVRSSYKKNKKKSSFLPSLDPDAAWSLQYTTLFFTCSRFRWTLDANGKKKSFLSSSVMFLLLTRPDLFSCVFLLRITVLFKEESKSFLVVHSSLYKKTSFCTKDVSISYRELM